MNQKFLLFTLALAAAALIHSCSTGESTMTLVVSSYATYQNTDSPACFVTDDSLRIVPTNTLDATFGHGAKVRIIWTYDAIKGNTNPIYSEITSYEGVMQGRSFLTERPDTLGTLGADLYTGGSTTPIWRSGGIYGAPAMINMVFQYLTNNNGSSHSVNLTYPSTACDSDGYFHMKFSHTSNDIVTPSLTSTDFCAFTIPDIVCAEATNGLIIGFDGLEDTAVKYRFTFATAKLEKLESEE